MRLSDHVVYKNPLVVLVGPTAVGKSHVAIKVAQALETEVLTADSRQVYRDMDIGTDKPSLTERQGIPHRLIDLVKPNDPFNVGCFRTHAIDAIGALYRNRRIPFVVGGTGLYVRGLVRGLCDGPQADREFRANLIADAQRGGGDFLHQRLSRVDPELARRLHPRDEVKIIRALEVHHLLGRPLSEVHRNHQFAEAPFALLLIGLTRERSQLYRRIEERVESQLAAGLVQETEGLLIGGYGRQLGSMKGLGYRQIAGYLAEEYDYDEAVRRLKRDTRHFAKRQLTWFRKEPGITWLSIGEQDSLDLIAERVVASVEHFLRNLESASERTTDTPAGMAMRTGVA
ncbi:MAG: tRNA (adenosine(37)-N6)-dimethylallyltransferase MiaA [Nitrospiraceae bacterium]